MLDTGGPGKVRWGLEEAQGDTIALGTESGKGRLD